MRWIIAAILLVCPVSSAAEKPDGLLIELLPDASQTVVTDSTPEFGWIYHPAFADDYQSAFRILVASSKASLESGVGDMWDSGKVIFGASINVEYAGKALEPSSTYYWQVQVWDSRGQASPFSDSQVFHTGERLGHYSTPRRPLVKSRIQPTRFVEKKRGHYFIDFGKAAFGAIEIFFGQNCQEQPFIVRLGEKLKDSTTVDRKPGGTIRYRKIKVEQSPGEQILVAPIPPDERNTREHAIKMPPEIGEVMPFRYAEIEKCPIDLTQDDVTMIAVHYPFDDSAASFECSDPVLNDVWELCKYSIKATSFCGVYVDGDRERIPYEADAYINQLGHYCVDREYAMARYSHEYLITHPTWPTEWILHSVLMAWADYLYTGDASSLKQHYNDLQAKTLTALARDDGLISTRTGLYTDEVAASIHFPGKIRDIVDWPPGSFALSGTGERDGYKMGTINTVVNAFHYQALKRMADISKAVDKDEEALWYRQRAEKVKAAINEKLFDLARGVYFDCEDSTHASLHANMFPLAFGIVPPERRQSVVNFIKSRGMACSVYGAQYLLDALYNAGEGDYALQLMTARHDRSWPHMIYDVGTTITLEAWDRKYKKNLDWNHAWGAAPANIIPRRLMGVQPASPGFEEIIIKPQPGSLKWARATVPTIRGAVYVSFDTDSSGFDLRITLPGNMTASVYLPATGGDGIVHYNGKKVRGNADGSFLRLDGIGGGQHFFSTGQH